MGGATISRPLFFCATSRKTIAGGFFCSNSVSFSPRLLRSVDDAERDGKHGYRGGLSTNGLFLLEICFCDGAGWRGGTGAFSPLWACGGTRHRFVRFVLPLYINVKQTSLGRGKIRLDVVPPACSAHEALVPAPALMPFLRLRRTPTLVS